MDTIVAGKNAHWWTQADPHEQIWADVGLLFEQHSDRIEQNMLNLRLYGNKGAESGYGSYDQGASSKLTLNVIQSAIDAANAKISTNKTRAMFLTEGGHWMAQQQAKKLTRFVDGQFKRNNTYKISRDVFRDAEIFDLGVMKHSIDDRDPKNPKICNERVMSVELLVDLVDGKYCEPRRIYQVKEIGREVILNDPRYKKYKSEIMQASLVNNEFSTNSIADSTSIADPITIIESYHLPSSPLATDGKMCISLSNVALELHPWKHDYFPFSTFRWLKKPFGYYGQGLAEQLRPLQISINKILRKIEQHMDKASSFVLASRGTKVVKAHLVNTPWTLLEYTGSIPTFATVQSISPEYFTQLDRLYARAFEIAGVSQLFAQAKLPPGLQTGKAIAEYKDNESERFQDIGQGWSEYQIDMAEKQIELAKILDKKTPGGYSVLAQNENDEKSLSRIHWKDVDLDRDAYIIQAYPTSYLPKLPAYRLDTVAQMAEVIPELRPYVPKLLDFPDVESVMKRLTAPIDYIEMVTDRMLYDVVEGVKSEDKMTEEDYEELYTPPDAFTDFQQALVISRGKLLRARQDNAPEKRLDLLIRYMTDIQDLIKSQMEEQQREQMEMQAEAQAQMGPPAAPPMLGPAPGPAPGPTGPMPPMPPEVM